MSYDPLIPKANDILSQSQVDIQTNFSQIGALFGSNASADHFAFDDATAAQRGLHKKVTFKVPLLLDPVVAAPEGFLYTKADATDTATKTQMYFENDLGVTRVTNRFTSAVTNGYTILPSGIIMMWGQVATPSSTAAQVVPFNTIANYIGSPVGFPNNVFNLQLSVEATSSGGAPVVVLSQGTLANTGFTLRVSASLANTVTHWFAIGN